MSRVLVDASPLVAMLDRGDADHARCIETARTLRGTFISTWSVITEACYLLAEQRSGQDALLARIESGDLVIDPLAVEDLPGLRTLLKKYRDVPMDLADATLVRVAEREGIDDIFTLDHHFRVYRTHRRRAFAVIP